MRFVLRAIFVLFCVGLTTGCGDDDPIPAASASLPAVHRWQRFETTLERPVGEANPFDPETISVEGEFESPHHASMVIPGFVTRDYQRQLVGGYEKVRPTSDTLQWKIRFTPTEVGIWRWRWRIQAGDHVEIGAWSSFQVTEAAGTDHGFVRRSPRDTRYLEFDDGSAFWALGENLAWYDGRGTFAYDDWLDKLAAHGCNYIRLWMPSWAFGLEWISRESGRGAPTSTLGNYTGRLDRAWQLDYVIDAARRRGIHVMLAIQNHGAFTLESNTEWVDNPYNIANGGMLATPRDFFTDEQAKRLFKRRLRYIVARWGYATNLMSWELWNEVDLAQQPSAAVIAAWHTEMARELRRLDPFQHLITTSVASNRALTNLWDLPEIDFAQIHYYAFDGLTTDFPTFLSATTSRLRRAGKPVLIGEGGVNPVGPAETLRSDPGFDGFHDILWSGLVGENFGSGMSWWWDNVVDPQDLYFHFGALAKFVAGVDFPGEAFQVDSEIVAAPGNRSLRVFLLRGENTSLVWIKNAAHNWYAPDESLIAGGTIAIDDRSSGPWEARWFDTRSGEILQRNDVPGDSAGSTTLSIPSFRRDIALRLDRRR